MRDILLIIEDNEADIALALRAFRAHGWGGCIEVVRDGVDALDFFFGECGRAIRCPEEMPRCVLLDLKLPRLDGHEVLRQLRAHPRTARIPVVVFTSSQEPRDVVRSYELGVNSYLVKPLDFVEFQRMAGDIARYWLKLNIVAPPNSAKSPVNQTRREQHQCRDGD